MHIKDMASHERPQEKLIYNGAESLSTSELLALIIRTGSREKSSVQLAEDILSYTASEIGALTDADIAELKDIGGIGDAKACSIVASLELAKRLYEAHSLPRKKLNNSHDVAAMLMSSMKGEKKERLVAILLNSKCEPEANITVSIGELSATSMHPREVLSPAIKRGAAAIIIAHNHPSGDPTPSDEDIRATRRLADASAIVGIKLFDHLIIGDKRYFSMAEEGLIN